MNQLRFANADYLRALEDPAAWASYEHRLNAFEEAWRQGATPQIQAYLLGEGSFRRALLVELVHLDLEFRTKAGIATRPDDYLAAFPELRLEQQIVDELQETARRLAQRTGTGSHGLHQARSDAAPHSPNREVATTDPPEVAGYEILAEIGRGGMGIVYQARDTSLSRYVALKFLPEAYADDAERLNRFRYEARASSALNHPHICTVHALGQHGSRPFIVMEFVEGKTLQQLIPTRPSLDDSLRWIGQAARALAAAHSAGVVHRDVKPENIMVRSDGYVKVVDFGLARGLPSLLEGSTKVKCGTDPGTILGSLLYMSPEQSRGAPADSASDVFSLGIVTYQLLTGTHPFQADSPLETLAAIAMREPIPPSRVDPRIPEPVDRLLEAMLQNDPRLRISAAEVEAAITALRRRSAIPTRRSLSRPVVHREPELTALRAALAQAEVGHGSIVCIAGEPGIGKTTLVEDFLGELPPDMGPLVARGQCSERLGESEAYLPVLDALEKLLRADTTGAVARIMETVAGTWFGKVAATSQQPGEAAGEGPTGRAASQQALLREFCRLVEAAAMRRPLILFLEDVHWADVSTVDLLAHLGRHCAQLRVAVILTYRPTELLLGPHPFQRVKLDLQATGVCREHCLGFLERTDVDRYLQLAFPDHRFESEFAEEIYARTEGSPLFMVDLLAYLAERQVIARVDGRWSLVGELPNLRDELPQSVRSMVHRKLDRLSREDRRILGAASVQGYEFDSAVVAASLGIDPLELEDRLQALDRVHGLVRFLSEHEFADRTLTLRYAFVHVLYQEALYQELSPGRRAALSSALAAQLEARQGELRAPIAAQLACLYETGRDSMRAAENFWLAAHNAAEVFAHHEAVALARRGLRSLASVDETRDRCCLELSLQTTLGLQLQVTQGYAAQDAKQAYRRARELCGHSWSKQSRFPVLWGLWLCHKVESDLKRAQEMADELYALAQEMRDPSLALQAHQALGMTAFCRGQPAVSLCNVEQAAALYHPEDHREHAHWFGQDPGVMCKAFGAAVLWLLGDHEAARRESLANIAMSQHLSPTTQAVALHFTAMVHQLLGDHQQTKTYSERSMAVAREHGLSFWLAGGTVLHGWARANLEPGPAGLNELQAGIRDWRATGSVTYETYYLGLLAEVLIAQKRRQEAELVLDEALTLVERTGERFYEAELYRLRGEANTKGHAARELDLQRALEIARQQEARSLELRALTSIVRLNPTDPQAHAALVQLLSSFAADGENRDVREAHQLLR